ncbi:uncharacterized protein LOC110029929 isoform X4 [Phalaenopsis equestris]|uniref:uncharacterized protein LOC110029929 isoform X4 n=1 Tax=Phalaenopsis equestris TaxID=78828 RepID=UPI0009E5489C|nr:uncharacterized protein LOC110029929 isoform X4 [Phalaenopsis equestris]
MALASGGRFMLPLIPSRNPPRKLVVLYSQSSDSRNPSPFLHHSPSTTTTLTPAAAEAKRCLRCSALYADADNSPTACAFHGHTTEGNHCSENDIIGPCLWFLVLLA